ncbi:MAG: hypothetical protein ACM34K_00680 [Bacillota bacterium]
MQQIKLIGTVLSVCLLCLSGCTTVKQEIFLQKAEVAGPINHPPVQVTQKELADKITISPRLYINNTRMLKAQVNGPRVNSSGYFQVDTVFNGDGTWSFKESGGNTYNYKGSNISWQLPEVSAGVDFDMPIGKSTSITGGLSYSVSNSESLFGGSLGLGIFGESGGLASRVSFGLNLQQYLYNASTIVITKTKSLWNPEETSILFYHDIDKNSKLNLYMSLTFNTVSAEMPFNVFLGASYFGQTLLNFSPNQMSEEHYPFVLDKYTTDTRSEASTSYLSVYPGIFVNITESQRVIVGASIMKELEGLSNLSQTVIVSPFVKIDVLF